MTPNDLDILIHYYVCPDIHERYYAPAVMESCREFVQSGIFVSSGEDGIFSVTEKGRAWMELILNTPMPILKWIDPREEK
jgi:hypothetical protein